MRAAAAVLLLALLVVPLSSPAKKRSPDEQPPCGLGPFQLPRVISPAPDPTVSVQTLATEQKKPTKVTASFIVTTKGEVSDIRIKKHGTPDLDRLVEDSLARSRFHPAIKNGKPCAFEMDAEFNFRFRPK